MKNNRKMLWVAICVLIVAALAGYAVFSFKQEPLEERVKNYMQAQVDNKWDQVYSFMDASSTEAITRENFVKQTRKLAYTGYAIDEITIDPSGDQATVKVKIDLSFMGYNFKGAPKTQNWVKKWGKWFVKVETRSQQTPFSPPQKAQ